MSDTKAYIFQILLIVLVQICICKNSYIIFPFKVYKDTESEFLSNEKCFQLKEDNLIYSIFKVGNPEKELPAFYTLYNSTLSIHSNFDIAKNLKSNYIPSNSKTFIISENKELQDEFILNMEGGKIIKNFTFLNQTQNKNHINLYLNIGFQNFYKELTSNEIEYPNY